MNPRDFENTLWQSYFLMGFVLISELLFTPTPITPLIGVEPVQLWGQRDCPSPKATLNGQSLLQFAPLSNKNFAKTGVGVNCNISENFHQNVNKKTYKNQKKCVKLNKEK